MYDVLFYIFLVNTLGIATKTDIYVDRRKNRIKGAFNVEYIDIRNRFLPPTMFDKIFIVNMKRSVERKRRLEEQFETLRISPESYTFIEAVDGQNTDLDSIGLSFRTIPDWAEPFSSKIMTKGEIGCSLSHYKIWQQIVDLSLDNVLILEDDAVFEHDFCNKLSKIDVSGLDYDLLYLGRRRVSSQTGDRTEEFIRANIVRPVYSYGTHAYILTNRGAKRMLAHNYLQHLLPLDEFFSILYDPLYPYEKFVRYFKDAPKLQVYSVDPLLIDVLSGDLYTSDTYHTDPYTAKVEDNNDDKEQNKCLVLAINQSNCKTDILSRFVKSCEMYGHSYKILDRIDAKDDSATIIGELATWDRDALANTTVIVLYHCEAMFNSTREEILDKYAKICGGDGFISLNNQNIVSARAPNNAIMGNANVILEWLYNTNDIGRIAEDNQSNIFECLTENSESILDILYGKSRIRNENTEICPSILINSLTKTTMTEKNVKNRGITTLYLNRIGNYLGDGWNSTYKYCVTNKLDHTPKIFVHCVGVEANEAIGRLDYPKEQLIIPPRNTGSEYSNAVHAFLQTDAEYFFHVEARYVIHNPNTLTHLLDIDISIVSPMLVEPDTYLSNFWGDLAENGYYKRSFDYLSIVGGERRACWNVPYVTGVYLVKRDVFERYPRLYLDNPKMDVDMRFCCNLREAQLFMYVTNLEIYGYIGTATAKKEENNDHNSTAVGNDNDDAITVYDVLNEYKRRKWEIKYLHPDFLIYRKSINHITKELCRDAFQFPVFAPIFCREIVDACNRLNKWSLGNENHEDPRLGKNGYENIPTQDIHLEQIGFGNHWEAIVTDYIAPCASKLFSGYKTKGTNISFVVRYCLDGQKELCPHHDASTYTINVALNEGEYEGGGCRFIRQDYKVTNQAIGTMLMHPGRLTHYHEGLPVTSGTRYILVSFIN